MKYIVNNPTLHVSPQALHNSSSHVMMLLTAWEMWSLQPMPATAA